MNIRRICRNLHYINITRISKVGYENDSIVLKESKGAILEKRTEE